MPKIIPTTIFWRMGMFKLWMTVTSGVSKGPQRNFQNVEYKAEREELEEYG